MPQSGTEGLPESSPNGQNSRMSRWQQNTSQTISKIIEPRPRVDETTIRIVTPDNDARSQVRPSPERFNVDNSFNSSPLSISGGDTSWDRRAGLAFDDIDETGSDQDASKVGRADTQDRHFNKVRPRGLTITETRREKHSSIEDLRSRHRAGSVHLTASPMQRMPDSARLSSQSSSLPSSASRASISQLSGAFSDKTGGSARRIVKKHSFTLRPETPTSSTPVVDSLPTPIPTQNPNQLLRLMKSLNGRMRGLVEYQTSNRGSWRSAICYTNENGALIHEGSDNDPYKTVIPDLRGCRVRPVLPSDRQERCLQINTKLGIKLRLLPTNADNLEGWLATFLVWQQTSSPTTQPHSEVADSRWQSFSKTTSRSIAAGVSVIKVAKILVWDSEVTYSASAIMQRPLKEAPLTRHSWRKVSCILQDNGDFILMTENDVSLMSTIQLPQLTRLAIQRLDQSVLAEEFCIGIYPRYTNTSRSISVFRPVYIALESRVLFEVWWVLLKSYCVPEFQSTPSSSNASHTSSVKEVDASASSDELFRIERQLFVRIVDARIRNPTLTSIRQPLWRPMKSDADLHEGNYSAEVWLDDEVRVRTTTKMDTALPFWREESDFSNISSETPKLSIVLKKSVMSSSVRVFRSSGNGDRPELATDIVCGFVQVNLDRLELGQIRESFWLIFNQKDEVIGDICLRIRHDKLVVLMSEAYKGLSETLHKFGNGLTIQIAQAVSSVLRPLSEILVNIFQVSGQSLAWFMTLIEDEVDGVAKELPVKRLRFNHRLGSNDSVGSTSEREQSVRDLGKTLTGEANLLFRGNSLLTHALDFHMRRLGREYLHEVLLDPIRYINAMNPDCEVDPGRISHQDDIFKNWTLLNALTTKVWENISTSASRCSPEIRHIMKYIRAVADDRYGGFLRTVPYTSVSGFLFLRFFCPAILNPKLFGLLHDHPQPNAQRALTLIAKSLQALANLSNFGQKESWMEPMNRFLSSQKQVLKQFIDEICSIPAERGVLSVPASYSTPFTILGRLPPVAREGCPSLPYLIDHEYNFAALIKIWLDNAGVELPPTSISNELREFHALCVDIKRRTDACLNDTGAKTSETTRTSTSSHSENGLEAFDLINSIEPGLQKMTFSKRDSTNTSFGDPGSSGSEADSRDRDRRERQSFWENGIGKIAKSEPPPEPEEIANPSPPERAPSRGEKIRFLTGLRRKDKDGKPKEKDTEREKRDKQFKEARERERKRNS